MAGNVSLSSTSYQIRHVEAGVHAIREVDPEAVRREAPPTRIDFNFDVPNGTPATAPDEGGKFKGLPDRTSFTPDDVSLAVSPKAPSVSLAGSGEFFDLLSVYTPAARTAAGGTAGIQSLIQLGVTETNLAYQNSGIIPRIRLVHTEELNYTEFDDLDIDLYMAQNGFIGNIHEIRDTYSADLVQLVTDSNALFCGKAYLMAGNNPGFSWWSYSVVEQSCISPNYSFGHELAHNMGSDHAPGDPIGVPAYSYSIGYKEPSSQFRTLMAYNSGCNCTRLLRHSSQSITYQGSPTGNSTQDNSLSINNVRFTVSGFRDEPGCEYSTSPGSQSFVESGGGGSLTVSTTGSCSWTSSSSDSWITVTGGGSGTGNGSVSYSVSSNPTTQSRSGNITVEGEVLTIDQDGLPCTYGLSSGSASFGFAGGSSSVGMTSLAGCNWTATSNQGWVTITAGASGSGNGTISYTVASNPTIQSRVATITAGGQVLNITQDGIPCTYSLSPGSANFDSNGGGGSFSITSPTGCAWTAASSDAWVTITAGGSGSGNGTVSYSVASNPTIQSRAATITAGGQVYSITQDGIVCTYSLSPGSANFNSDGGGGSFSLTSPTGCAWTASSSDAWVTITAGGSGSGNGTVSYSVASNPTTQSRAATITAGGQVYSITQDGIVCTYSLSPGSANFDSNGGGGSFSMTSPTGCTWTASSSDSWITITAGGSGSGDGTISYTVASNGTINSRSGTITAEGQVYTITQDGIPCTYSLSPSSNSLDSNGGGGSVSMTSPTGCAWTASSSDSWITITAGGSGSGNGSISYTVASNGTINSRSGTITAGGQTLTITQTGIDCTYTLSSASASFDSDGGGGVVGMTSPTGCNWTASSSDSWITITAGASGSGNGSIAYTVASNGTINSRSGTITAGGQTLTITQTGIDCTYALSSASASFDSDGGGGVVGMTSPTGCNWTASSSDSWITITAGASGSGNGSISYTVASNGTINSRSGTITAGGQTLTITQTGIDCTYALSSASASFDSDGGGGVVGMTSPTGCNWTASSSDSWITITAGGSGSGNGNISYSVASNPTIQTRSATITGGGQTLTITQTGIDCTYSLSAASASFDSDGGGGVVGMTSPTGCNWTASSSDSWITITAGASGSGNGSISYTVASNGTITSRSGTITAGGQTLTITQTGIDCTYALSSASASFDSDGGGGVVGMTSPTGCSWTASSSDSWITITAGSSGSGNGSISYTVASNGTINSRSGTITAGGQTLTITQTGIDCTYALSSASASFDSDGGGGVVGMTSPTGCNWTASSSDGWITITAGASGSGNGSISYTVASNGTINSRSGTITAGGQTLTITQTGIDCTYALSSASASFDSDGGGGVVGMTSPTGCSWTASSSDSWITITAGASGSGNGSISYTVASNGTINSRSGTITAGGQTLTITQTGIDCTYALSSASASFDSDGGGGVVGMTSPTGCSWTASSSDSWITITAGGSGNGNGNISYSVASNPTIQTRSGTITVAGQTLTITQTGIDCTYSLSSASASFDSDGGSGSLNMTSPTGCTWTASSSAGWITITAGASGSGNGAISYTVASNGTINSRSGTITAGGQTLTITQTGIDCTYSLSAASASFDSDGGGGVVGMTSPTGCNWTASSSDSWITITAGGSGNGNGNISYSVASNPTIQTRSGTITAGGQTLTITQTGIDCTYSLSAASASFDSDGGSGSLNMTSPTGCTWTASSSAGWITITAGASGSGNGSISYSVASNPTIQTRSGTITVAGQTLTITQTGIDCTYSLSSSSASFDSDGGGGVVGVTSPTGCSWTASSSDAWITITAGGSGDGNGSISYSVALNGTINSRSGTITAAGQTLTITQSGINCTFELSSNSASFDFEGGDGSFGMTSPSGCSWTASSSDSWITLTSGASGSGDGTIFCTVASNPTIQTRSGTITAAGQTMTITQTGIDCTYSLSSGNASFDSDGGGGSVGMSAPAGCNWTASSSDSWITITAGSGSGDGSLSYTVDSNSTIQTRSGTITTAGQTLTVTQSGIDCTYSLSSSSVSLDSNGGSGSVGMTTPTGCSWTASSNESWITITAGASGSGDGSIAYTVDANSTIDTRTGTITAAGQTLTITQSGINCSFDLSSNTASFDSDGGSATVGMTSPTGCSWTASSNESWITITAGASGSGDGSIAYTVDSNSTIDTRTGTITAAGQTLTITQSGINCSFDLSSNTASFDSDGGGGSVGMTAPSGCTWTASSSTSWITITAGASGSGDGTIGYTVNSHSTIDTRTGTIAAAGKTLTITQSGIDCSFELSSSNASFDSDGGTGSVGMTSPAGCDWTASSSAGWLTITAGASGSGDGTIAYTVDANSTIQTRTGTVTASGQTLTITQSGIDCSFDLSSNAASFDSDGGSGSVAMTSPAGCDWTASSNESWITITAGASASGDGTIAYTVDANSTIQTRTGTITASGQTLTITQSGIDCSFDLSSNAASFDSDGASGSVGMTSPAGCDWTASSNESWITITAGASGSGDGTIAYTVDANSTIQTRTGTITASGQTLTITQSGIDCSFDLSSNAASFDSDGASGSVGMTSPAGCDWTVSSNESWITITAGASGSGDGTITYTVDANSTIQTRTGTITASGQTLTITQSGIDCSFDLSSGNASFDSDGGAGSVSVTSPSGCLWDANSSDAWISITGTPGTGNGSISYTVAANPTLQSRSGTIMVEDQVLSLTQEALSCTYSLSPSSASFESDGGSSTASITAPDVCSWSASSSEGWITITAGSGGSGNGSLSFTVAPNTTIESRSGTISVEDKILTITQSRIDCSYSLSSTSSSFNSDGGSGSVNMTSPEGCSWSASSISNWINISSGSTGSGSSTVSFTVDANPTVNLRVGSLTIGGEVFTITQEGILCTYSLFSSSVSFNSDNGSGTVRMTSPSGCAWTASSSESWIAIVVTSGDGDGSISYNIETNPSIQSRSGTIAVEGQVLTVTQGGIDCTYSLSPSSGSFDPEGGSSSTNVGSPDGCQWSASSSDSWISITSGDSGSGDGPVSFTVAANTTIQARSGSLTVGGQIFTITQEGIPCTYSLSPGVTSFDSDGGSSSTSVNSPDGCEWSASSGESWITITTGATGSGADSLSFSVAANDTILSRSGTIALEGQVLTITQDGIECTYSLSSGSASFDSGGGSSSIDLTSPTGCSWTASSSESWITISSGTSGSGDGSVSFVVAANTTIQSRAGVVTIGGQVLTITQGGIDCTYSLSLQSASFDSSGGSSSVTVTSPDGCEWSASSNDSWIAITAGASDSGDGPVSFAVAANTSIQSRSGAVMVGGQAFTITQDGIACTYSLTSDSASLDAGGGSGSVGLDSPDGCEWTASNGESWITINGESSGSGNGSISFTATANTTIFPRSGTLTVEGQLFTITQDGIDCSYSLSTSAASFGADGGSSRVSVSSPDGCEWSASGGDNWVTISSGASGSGDGGLSFSISANSTIQSRSGTITVEGQVLTITQGGIDCTYSLSPGSASMGSDGGSSSVGITSPDGCEWSASSSELWITIGPGASGSGDGSVTVSVAANPSIQSRSGSIMVGGEAFVITQDGVTCSFSLSSSSASFDAESGSSSVGVSSPDGCEWSATVGDSWIAISAGSNGSGDGSVFFTVTANTTIESRSGTITVEGEVLTITQGGIDCTYSLSPSAASLGSEGGSSSLEVNSPEGCEWSASSSDSWITIGSGGGGSGSGSVAFTVDGNTTIESRSGTIVVGGQVFTITQEGISCSYALSSSSLSLGSEGGIGSVGISSPEGCEWSTSSGDSWIVVGDGSSGTGSGNASFTVAANDTIQSRSGTVLIEGQVLTVTQEGIDCTYSISPVSASFDAEGGSGVALVTSPEGCQWSASSSDGWVEIGSAASGSGSGSLSFTVASNESTQSRTATITIAELELSITQGGIDCTYSLSPGSASFDAEGGSSSVSVTSPEGCEWSASASEGWITVSSGGNGSGSGSVSFTVDASTTIQTRSGTIVAGGQVFAITQDGISCTYAMSSISSSFDAEGGSSSVSVTSAEGCEWSASSGDSWIIIGEGASGSGSSDVPFTVVGNTTIESRSGTIEVEGQVLTVTQDGIDCTYSLSPTSVSFDPEGGNSTANVTSPQGCEWSASSSDSWITIGTGSSGSGNGSVSFTVEANSSTEPRSGTITVEDRVLTITQSRIDCSLSLSFTSVNFDSDGGVGSVDVTSPEGCNWSVFSGDSWISVSGGASANGNGSVSFIVDPNNTTESRSGTIVVEDEVLTIDQSGTDCSFSLSSDSVSFDSDGGEGSVGVLSPSGCGWSASSGDSWITLASASQGEGDGFISFSVDANSATQPRSGTITIEDQVLTITQSGIECTYSLTADNVVFASNGGTGSVDITAPEGCSWSAASNGSWLVVAAGSSGEGSGSVSFTVAANSTPTSRSASISVEGQVLTITQDGVNCSYSLSPGYIPFTSDESSGTVTVTSSEGCDWSASSSHSWISLVAGNEGSGSGSIAFTVAANPSTESRSGSVTVEDQVVTIDQSGIDCSYSLSSNSTSIDGAGGSDEIYVSAPEGCLWTASSNAEWIVVAQGDRGTGNGSFLCVVGANPTIESRSGTLEIESQSIMVTQAGAECTYAASATSTLFEGNGGSGSVTITTLDGCNWSAATGVEWITLGDNTASSGSGTVEFEVSPNPSGETRTGTVAIEDTLVTLTQAWDSGPTLDLELSAETYAVGSFVEATSLRLSNSGPQAVETELWLVLEMPGDVHVSFFHLGADGSVLLPSQFSEDFGPITLFEITQDLPTGNYALTGLVRDATTAELLSQDIKTFLVVNEQGDAGDPRDLSTDPRIQSGIPRLPKTTEGWLRSLERLAKPRGDQRKSLPVPSGRPR